MTYQQSAPTIRSRSNGLILAAVTLAACLSLPWVLGILGWAPAEARAFGVTLGAFAVGLVLGHARVPRVIAWFLAIALGLELAVQISGGILPPFRLLVQETLVAGRWVWQFLTQRQLPPSIPFAASWEHIAARATDWYARVYYWFADVAAGRGSEDSTVLVLGVALATWLVIFHAAFEMFHSRRTMVALAPLGLAVVMNASFTHMGMNAVYLYVGATLLALLWNSATRMEQLWERANVDFSPELRDDVLTVGVTLSAVIFVIALVFPYVTFDRAVWFFWDNVSSRLEPLYQSLDEAFAGRNPIPTPTPMPVAALAPHELLGGQALSSEVVMLVDTSDPIPPTPEELMIESQLIGIRSYPRRYWRQRNYDIYTGSGWDLSERNVTSIQADRAWREVLQPHELVTQTYRLLTPLGALAFGVAEPISASVRYEIVTRGEDDLVAFSVTTDTYTVVSWLPDVTMQELRQAEGPYPDWVTARYLPLPEIPDRIGELARQVVEEAEATTRYDQARAIEAYLRQYAYDLTLPPPPLDQDVVDYFLFDAQRGFCDYSATAMTVMLRTLGIAARYASGYHTGTFDHAIGAWVVQENDAHAWTEVFFPGYGWLTFEPTPTQPVFELPASRPGGTEYGPGQAAVGEEASIPTILLWAGGLVVLVLFMVIWPPRWFVKRRPASDRVLRAYSQVVHRARWLGVQPEPGQTPREYLAILSAEIDRRTQAGWSQDVHELARLYQKARYSQHDSTEEEGDRATAAWKRLGPRLLRLTLIPVD